MSILSRFFNDSGLARLMAAVGKKNPIEVLYWDGMSEDDVYFLKEVHVDRLRREKRLAIDPLKVN